MSVSIGDAKLHLKDRQRRLYELQGQRVALNFRHTQLTAELEDLRDTQRRLQTAIEVLTAYADKTEKEALEKAQGLATLGMTTVFGEDVRLVITQTQRGNLTSADITIASTLEDGTEIQTDVMSARGGGLAAIAGFMLRLTVLLLNPNASKLMVLDETFAQLSEEYEPRLADFMRQLVDKTSIQIILVTHSPAYDDVADVAYRLTQANGKTTARRLR